MGGGQEGTKRGSGQQVVKLDGTLGINGNDYLGGAVNVAVGAPTWPSGQCTRVNTTGKRHAGKASRKIVASSSTVKTSSLQTRSKVVASSYTNKQQSCN